MTVLLTPPSTADSLADLLDRLGVPANRVRLRPAPGTAAEQDVVEIHCRERRLYELVEGTLVEKARALRESILAGCLIELLRRFVIPRNSGVVSGEAGMMRLFPGLVRIPDVAFASWSRFPNRSIPTDPIPSLVPDLAVEILSLSNTAQEMARKCHEYFLAGVRLVWLIDPRARTVDVYTAEDQVTTLTAGDMLDGGVVLPGFTLPLSDFFAELDRTGDRPQIGG
jgi:Uma2 family endonuclease